MIPDDRYEIRVEDVFEGPMDLLIYLIKKNEVEIYDIPIALITDQYLEYLEWMKAMNINVAGDFILMASTLAHIKSRMLLPPADTGEEEEEEEEDPRLEIARPLLEYLRMKSVARQLGERPLLGEDTFVRGASGDDLEIDRGEQEVQVSLFDLIEAFQTVLDRVGRDHRVDFSEERFSIKDKIAHIIAVLEEMGAVTFTELFENQSDLDELVTTFLAMLELAKLNLIRITQHVHTGIIRLFYI